MKRIAKCSEWHYQKAIFDYARLRVNQIPEWGMLFAIPNGGSRHPVEAARLKATGVKRGVPDMFLPVPKGKWHGLFIELKSDKGGMSLEQRAWMDALRALGYYALVCFGADAAIERIEGYLRGDLA